MSKPAPPTTRTDSDAAVPTPRAERVDVDPAASARHANDGLIAVRRAGARLSDIVNTMDDATAHGPSTLPGWTRRHVVSHLARNADALVNLLTWARTGVEHPMYPSKADRNADIEQGAQRLFQVLREDLDAATSRFLVAADDLPESCWSAPLVNGQGKAISTSKVPWMRLIEILVHLIDLDCGVTFDEAIELAGEQAATLLDQVILTYAGRSDVPAVLLHVSLPDGDRTWTLGPADGSADDDPHEVSGKAGAVLAWLTGRDRTPALEGNVPDLPDWL